MSQNTFLSERTTPVLMAINASSSYTVASSSSVDLTAYGADSLFIVATVTDTTLTGFTMTATGGASTSAMGGLCVAAGSTVALLTVGTTAPAKTCYIDVKRSRHRYVGAKHTGLAASVVSILGFPYDSKKQPLPLSTSLGSTVAGSSSFITSVTPTTA